MKKIFPYLTYAGSIPFVLCSVFLINNIQKLPLLGSVEKILSVYGLVISSFLAGAHWGQHLYINKGVWNKFLPILSTALAVLLWLSFLVLDFKMLMVMFVLVFIILFIVDYRLFKIDFITHNYLQTRFFVTTIVVVSLIISGALSL